MFSRYSIPNKVYIGMCPVCCTVTAVTNTVEITV